MRAFLPIAALSLLIPATAPAGQVFVDGAVTITPGAPGVPIGLAFSTSYRWAPGTTDWRFEGGPFVHVGWNAWRGFEIAAGGQAGVVEPSSTWGGVYVPKWDAWVKLAPALIIERTPDEAWTRWFGAWGEFGGAHDLGNPGMLAHIETGTVLAPDQPMRIQTSLGIGGSLR